MFFTIFYNLLGIVCLLALIWLIKSILPLLKKIATPLKIKIQFLFLGMLAGLLAFLAGEIVRDIVFFVVLDWPSQTESLMIGLLYLAAGVAWSAAYGLSKLTARIWRRAIFQLMFYSALVVVAYFTLQPIGYNWLRLLGAF